MSNTREIKRRIKSIQSTQKITKAMEMVAAAKMRKAVDQVLISRHYSNIAWEIIQKIATSEVQHKHPLLREIKNVKKVAILTIASNRGLCGGFNSNLFKTALAACQKLSANQIEFEFITFGKQIAAEIRKKNLNIVADFAKPDLLQNITTVSPIAHILLDGFISKKYQQVLLVYTDFQSSLKQTPVVKQLLPLKTTADQDLGVVGPQSTKKSYSQTPADTHEIIEYKFEPSPAHVLDEILPRILEIQVYQAVLESDASEHSARMMAMKNAHTAATDVIDSLTLAYNQARQAAITQEIAEIVAGANAI
ncbi:MAG: ATP synthase F1 subunit gamma [Patescibacteria group bacterium]